MYTQLDIYSSYNRLIAKAGMQHLKIVARHKFKKSRGHLVSDSMIMILSHY